MEYVFLIFGLFFLFYCTTNLPALFSFVYKNVIVTYLSLYIHIWIRVLRWILLYTWTISTAENKKKIIQNFHHKDKKKSWIANIFLLYNTNASLFLLTPRRQCYTLFSFICGRKDKKKRDREKRRSKRSCVYCILSKSLV